MFRVALLCSAAAVVTGLIWIFTVGTLLGALLIVGGVGGLGWAVVPAAIERVAVFLSTGRRRY